MNARIIILNYNGHDLLEKCLPSVVEAARRASHPCKITVLENPSANDSESWVRTHFPDVDFIRAPENRILFSYNDYVQRVTEEIVILLNNDVRVEPDFVDPLVKPFSNAEIFFTAPQSRMDPSGHYEGSLSKMEIRSGLLWGSSRFPGYEILIAEPSLTMQCGFGAFRREYFLRLGGYDDLYFPGTVEDSDLCFRAYRMGWRGVYCPESVVHHVGQATFKKSFGAGGLKKINRRNLYLFMWKNVRDPFFLAAHVAWLPVHVLKYALKGERDFLSGLAEAVKALPKALARRKAVASERSVRSDREIFALSRSL